MAVPVLATKLYVPPPRAHAIERLRLLDRLHEGFRAGRKLTLISAPAGFGKSTLLAAWVASTRTTNASTRVSWLSLDENDNAPERFVAHLVAALRPDDPMPDDPMLDGVWPSIDATLTAILNAVAAEPGEVLLVLDDFHVIERSEVLDAVTFLLDNGPPGLRVAIASRSDPLLHVARLRARGELTELRAADLRFTTDETAAFLTEMMGATLTDADVAALDSRTEGWIAGLQLAALSMRGRTDVGDFIAGFTGSHRFVIDYLAEEVLHRQPAKVRDFLLHTAILDVLSGPLCDAVTGGTDGAAMLESLDRSNLFLVPLDDRRESYRYHHLFADVLRARLTSESAVPVADLHRRASVWFELNGRADESVPHAIAAGDFDGAARVIEAAIPGVRTSRHDSTLLGWLALLPADTIRRRPVLSVFSAWAALLRGQLDAAESHLADAEVLLGIATPGAGVTADTAVTAVTRRDHDSAPGPELDRAPVTIALYRAAIAQSRGDFDAMRVHAARALALTAPDDHLGRGAATGMLGLAAWAGGDLEAATTAFGETRDSLRRAGNIADSLSTTMVRADMLTALGRLREVEREFDAALTRARRRQTPDAQPVADLHSGLSEVLRERNLIAAAREHLTTSESLGPAAFTHEHRYRWFVAMARLSEAEANPVAALDHLASAALSYVRGFFPDVRPIGGLIARVHITQGRLDEARDWVAEQRLTAGGDLSYLHEFGHITLARLLVAQSAVDSGGSTIDVAITLLDRLLDAAIAGQRSGSAMEILVVRAMAFAVSGRASDALESVTRALESAEPEGYVRLFVDEGAPMHALLHRADEVGVLPDYVGRLLRAFSPVDAAPTAPAIPLSDREAHVLRLLATELTGPEIARELYISLNTLRTHTKHIFTKLDVSSRPAAVDRGVQLGLI